MKIALIIAGSLVALVLVIVLIGYMLPVKHRATRQATLPSTPEAVFALISDVASYPGWRPSVNSIEMLPPDAGTRFKETSNDGAIPYVVEESAAPRRRVTRIADTTLPFGGRWTYDVAPAGTGSILRITEDGEVYNPVFRFMSRFIFAHHGTIETYLTDVSRKFGVPPQIAE